MPTDPSSYVKLEIGHVLFIDIVGYSKLLINEQSEEIQTLKEIGSVCMFSFHPVKESTVLPSGYAPSNLSQFYVTSSNGLKALGGTLVGFSPGAKAPPGPDPGSPMKRGVLGGAVPFKFDCGGMAMVTTPELTQETGLR